MKGISGTLKLAVWIMAVMAILLVIGSIGTAVGWFDDFYSSGFVLIPTAVLAVDMILCLVWFPLRWRTLGFFVGHIGLVVLIVSAVVSLVGKTETSFAIPVNPHLYYGSVTQDDGREVSFGFDIALSDFRVEKYDPDYRLYRVDSTAETGLRTLRETVIMDRKGVFHMGQYGDIPRSALEKDGVFVDHLDLGDGLVLVKLQEADRGYSADLNIRDTESGEVQTVTLQVNHPHTCRGWKFYLMDYDRQTGKTVQLFAKRDPGNLSFGIGLFLVVTGTCLMCGGHLVHRKPRTSAKEIPSAGQGKETERHE